jgi:chaperonin cofactor prefoldin
MLPCVRKSPLKGPQLAYYLKKRNPELYQKAKEIKEKYNVTWDEAFAILKSEKPLPKQAAVIDSEIRSTINDVVKRVEALEKRIKELDEVIYFLEWSLSRRFRFEEYRCVYMDDGSCCIAFYLMEPVKGFRLREVVEKGKRMYYLSVETHKYVCALCPRYTPKYLAETLNNLRSRQEFLELWLKSLESQVTQLQQAITQQSDKGIREALERLKRLGL